MFNISTSHSSESLMAKSTSPSWFAINSLLYTGKAYCKIVSRIVCFTFPTYEDSLSNAWLNLKNPLPWTFHLYWISTLSLSDPYDIPELYHILKHVITAGRILESNLIWPVSILHFSPAMYIFLCFRAFHGKRQSNCYCASFEILDFWPPNYFLLHNCMYPVHC